AKTQVLVLDDWGLVGLDTLTREALMEILDDRAGARATLVTSQLPVEHWHAWIGEPALADAMLDRMLPQAHRIVLKGESLRAPERSGGSVSDA
ncbi:ATP-binding protein, partial [Castellaniella sp. S9]|uniref:ATP-binding protein n=1 Tax=Castellaniella sp. S9 TaxID=2993652 RepID=UPI0022B43E4C